jgi:hypothetical protein
MGVIEITSDWNGLAANPMKRQEPNGLLADSQDRHQDIAASCMNGIRKRGGEKRRPENWI